MLVHVGGGELCGRTTGANALFCFTADTMFAGEKEKIPEELLQLDGKLVDEAMVGLEGTTERVKKKKIKSRKGIHSLVIFLTPTKVFTVPLCKEFLKH